MVVIHNYVNGQPQCGRCRHRDLVSKGTCSRCRQHRRLTRLAGLAGLCEPCAGIKSQHICSRCGVEDRLYKDRLCARCNVRGALEPHIEQATPDLAEKLGSYLDALIETQQPWSTMHWIRRSAAYDVLIDILAGRRPPEHDALDAADGGQAIEHLRSALVTHGALPPRDDELFRFTRWLDEQTGKVSGTTDHQHLKTWVHWHLLNDLNYRRRRGKLTGRSVQYARLQVRQTIAFIEWLHGQDLQLAECEQGHIDEWFALGNTTSIRVTSFVRWAVKNRLIPKITIPRVDRPLSYRSLQDTERRVLIDRLISDSSIDLRDRVAGLLVLIYGQPISRIARLQLGDVKTSEQEVLLRLGKEPIAIVEPLASLLAEARQGAPLKSRHRGHKNTMAFPGKVVGLHLNYERLRNRLRLLGIPSRTSRASALLPLAREVPAPILAETLGLSEEKAADWARAAE